MISKRRLSSIRVSLVLLSLAFAAETIAQAPSGSGLGQTGGASLPSPERPDWGGSDGILYAVGYSEFTPITSFDDYSDAAGLPGRGRHSSGFPGFFSASPHLPSGVLLTFIELDYCDNSGPHNVTLRLEECSFLGTGCNELADLDSDNGLSGCSFVSVGLTPYTTNNNTRRLYLTAFTSSGTAATALVGAYIGYRLQVSPAPASATFLDVPTTHPYFRFVEALADAGITGGCGGNNYCVDSQITRGEMAVFLAAALGLHFPN